jgi:tetratricopeptide (TPR) repeat protein
MLKPIPETEEPPDSGHTWSYKTIGAAENIAEEMKPGFKILILALFAIVIYCNTLSVPFVLDDRRAIIDNPVIRDFDFFIDPAVSGDAAVERRAIDFPKTRYIGYLSFAVNYYLHGLDVAGYHIINILIHIANGLLVYWLVLLMTKTAFFRDNASPRFNRQAIAFFSAMLFLCHPVQTQAVTYIVQRFASLATMFYLLSVALYVKARLASDSPFHHYIYAGSILAAVASMFTKEISFTLPLVIVMCEFFFFRGRSIKTFLYVIPFLILLLIIPLTVTEFHGSVNAQGAIENAVNVVNRRGISGADYLLTQFCVIITYIRLLFFPAGQNLDYDYPVYDSFLSYPVIVSFTGLCFIAVFSAYCFVRSIRHSSISDYLRLISFGIFWFFITLSVESSVIPISDVIFEHRLYLPSIGFFLALVASILAIGHKATPYFRLSGGVAVSIIVVFILVLSTAAYQRNSVWQSAVSIWEDTASKSPAKIRPHFQLGIAYLDAQRYHDAIRELNMVSQMISRTEDFLALHYNLGVALFKTGLYNEASDSFKKALILTPLDFNSHLNLAVTYVKLGQPSCAEREFKAALRIKPEDRLARTNMAIFYEELGDQTSAAAEYRRLMKSEPQIPERINNQGVALFRKGDLHAASKKYKLALELNPNLAQAHYNLALTYKKTNRTDLAIKEFESALALKNDLAIANFELALIYKERRQFAKAVAELRAALNIKTDYAEAKKELTLIQQYSKGSQ